MEKTPTWYQINTKKDAKTAEILIYEQIGEDFWSEGVGAKSFVKDLSALKVDYIQLRINSPGGNVFDGNAIYNALKAHPATVNVKIDGIAASIASVIAMAGDNIEMPINAMMMIHNPSGLVMGTAEDMSKMAEALGKIKTGLVAAYHGKSDMDNDRISELMDAETWMTAQEANDYGFADTITEKVNIQASIKDLEKYKNVPKAFMTSLEAKAKIDLLNKHKGETEMADITLDFIRNDHPDIAKMLTDEGFKNGMEKGLADGKGEGAKTELARIKAVQAQILPGHEKLIGELMFDGTTTGEQAAVKVLAAENMKRETTLADHKEDSTNIVVPEVNTDIIDPVDPNLPVDEQCKLRWDKSADLRAEFGDDLAAYVAYEKAMALGRVKVLKK
jgi:ATP-dependent Clp protease protease subunit